MVLPSISTIQGSNWLSAIAENIALDQYLSAVSGVNPSIHTVKIGIVYVSSSESQTGSPASDIVPVVVVLRNMQMASIFGSIIITVPNEGSLPMVMEISVGDRYPF